MYIFLWWPSEPNTEINWIWNLTFAFLYHKLLRWKKIGYVQTHCSHQKMMRAERFLHYQWILNIWKYYLFHQYHLQPISHVCFIVCAFKCMNIMIEWTIIQFLNYYDHFWYRWGIKIFRNHWPEIKWKIPGLSHKTLHELPASQWSASFLEHTSDSSHPDCTVTAWVLGPPAPSGMSIPALQVTSGSGAFPSVCTASHVNNNWDAVLESSLPSAGF